MSLDLRVSVREAQGSDLQGWTPGQPLPAFVRVRRVVPMSLGMCPFGATCSRCQGGYAWNPITAEHSKKRSERLRSESFRRRMKRYE